MRVWVIWGIPTIRGPCFGGPNNKDYSIFVETEYVLRSTLAQEKVCVHVTVFWGSLLHNLRLSAVANFLFLATFKP